MTPLGSTVLINPTIPSTPILNDKLLSYIDRTYDFSVLDLFLQGDQHEVRATSGDQHKVRAPSGDQHEVRAPSGAIFNKTLFDSLITSASFHSRTQIQQICDVVHESKKFFDKFTKEFFLSLKNDDYYKVLNYFPTIEVFDYLYESKECKKNVDINWLLSKIINEHVSISLRASSFLSTQVLYLLKKGASIHILTDTVSLSSFTTTFGAQFIEEVKTFIPKMDLTSITQDTTECRICNDKKDVLSLPQCNHEYCLVCLNAIKKDGFITCPGCRKPYIMT